MGVSSTPFKSLNAETCVELRSTREIAISVCEYDLATTLDSGQAFGWQHHDGEWTGIVHGRWVSLKASQNRILVRTAANQREWSWITGYLQTHVCLRDIIETFPPDVAMQAAVTSCRGLRLLRQEPWECLASFILSSTKQIKQIKQVVQLLKERFGEPIPNASGLAMSFPSAQRLASATESEMRDCKMGFRAPYLLAAARSVAGGICDLESLHHLSVNEARGELLKLPGVGPKIADCVLLFAYGFPTAFPVDVWIAKVIRKYYPESRRANARELREFAGSYFGPHAGYAQQYLFHHARKLEGKIFSPSEA